MLAEWLVLGTFHVRDSVENFDDDLLGGEADVSPTVGDKTDDREWRRIEAPWDDPMIFGAAGLPWVELESLIALNETASPTPTRMCSRPEGGRCAASSSTVSA